MYSLQERGSGLVCRGLSHGHRHRKLVPLSRSNSNFGPSLELTLYLIQIWFTGFIIINVTLANGRRHSQFRFDEHGAVPEDVVERRELSKLEFVLEQVFSNPILHIYESSY